MNRPEKEVDRKDCVYRYFDKVTQQWNDIYEAESLEALHLRIRKERVLGLIDNIGFSSGSKALDLGCGAGLTTLALLQKGFRVEAFDISDNMLGVAKRNCLDAGFSKEVSFVQGDAEHLRFPPEHFDLAVSMGLFGYVPNWGNVIKGLGAAIKPGGYLVVTFQSKYGLSHLVNPRSLRLGTIRNFFLRQTARSKVPQEDRFSGSEFKRVLKDNLLQVVSDSTFGFGPFVPLGQKILPETSNLRLYLALQRRADAGSIPFLAQMGKTHVLVARKSSGMGCADDSASAT